MVRLTVAWYTAVSERYVGAVHHLVDAQPIPNQQRRDHAARWDSIRFSDERTEGEKDCDDYRKTLHVLPDHIAGRLLRKGARFSGAPLLYFLRHLITA